MKFWQAMREFENGRSVRCKEWLPGHFMNIDQAKDNTAINDRMGFWCFKHEEWEYSPVEKSAQACEQEKGS